MDFVPDSPFPRIMEQPTSLTARPGGAARFTVGASGSAPLAYQWRCNGTPIPPTANPTASTQTLELDNLRDSDA
ncbi:MAG: immunoglobulin domain-containing protein, partial [candidate division NC10 bacterium]